MIVKSLKLSNFRSFSSKTIDFSSGFNIIHGLNATGKTTIIEALSLLSVAKSFRSSNYKEIINDSSKYFLIEGTINQNDQTSKVLFYQDFEKRQIKINNEIIKKTSDFVGNIKIIDFYLRDFFLLNGSPRDRILLFDRVFCQISKEYLEANILLNKVLKERNELLKRLKIENSKELYDYLDAVDQLYVANCIKIISFRQKIIPLLSKKINEIHSKIAPSNEKLIIEYKPNVNVESLNEQLLKAKNKDLERGYTTVGPHRDDYIFIINNKNIVIYGSQGQQKNSLLSLKIAFAEYLKENYNVKSILVFDDVFSDLDRNRQNKLFEYLNSNFQTIITTSSISDLDQNIIDKANIIEIEKE